MVLSNIYELPPSVMLCGLDLPRVDVIVICRPFSHLSSIIQAGGRGGRLLTDGKSRQRVAVYLLYNKTDVRSNAKHISNDVRDLYTSTSCIKKLLFDHFSVDKANFAFDKFWCCNLHS